jgi:hypothetical protein
MVVLVALVAKELGALTVRVKALAAQGALGATAQEQLLFAALILLEPLVLILGLEALEAKTLMVELLQTEQQVLQVVAPLLATGATW